MIAPLAQCIGAGCASITPATTLEKGLIGSAILILSAAAIFAIFSLLDTPDRRHAVLHRIWKSKTCGRCVEEIRARHNDREMNAAALRGPLALSMKRGRA